MLPQSWKVAMGVYFRPTCQLAVEFSAECSALSLAKVSFQPFRVVYFTLVAKYGTLK